MQKNLLIIFVSSVCSLIFIRCSYNETQENLDTWVGNYSYEEEPVKSIAGYPMVMVWKFSITKESDSINGILEINGQQTYIKVLTGITGDSNKIAVTYNSVIDGFNKGLEKGDTLFTLSKNGNELSTSWFTLQSQLLERSAKECTCFVEIRD